jgi:hypothetical protein
MADTPNLSLVTDENPENKAQNAFIKMFAERVSKITAKWEGELADSLEAMANLEDTPGSTKGMLFLMAEVSRNRIDKIQEIQDYLATLE